MSAPVPELHRPFSLARIGPQGAEVTVTAAAEECAALARRFRLPAIAALTCRFRLRREPAGVVVGEGELAAEITEVCVVTLDPFPASVGESFIVRFVPEPAASEEIDIEAVDEIPYSGDSIDLGEAAAQQLALALDPYPRKPGAELPGAAGDVSNPFAVLRRPN